MITEEEDHIFLDFLADWLEEMHRLGRFNACHEHGNSAIKELTNKIRKIAFRLAKEKNGSIKVGNNCPNCGNNLGELLKNAQVGAITVCIKCGALLKSYV